MGIPQITERMRMGPTEVLRAVFTGIGRILMTADRPDVPAASQADQAVRANGRPGPRDQGRQRPSGAAPAASRWRSLDETGNVRLLSPEDLDDGASEPGQRDAADLPLPGYDGLSLASIRARLRGLDAAQLRVLVSYEATHAERPEVLGMFERRIEKLEAGG
jgi:hypothetical protein